MSRLAISVVRGGRDLHAAMDGRFGRAGAFLVVDRETGEAVETIENAAANAPHGAGPAAANALRSAGVGAVVSGRFGPKAFDVLQALGIETWVAPPGLTAGEALHKLRDGHLERMQS